MMKKGLSPVRVLFPSPDNTLMKAQNLVHSRILNHDFSCLELGIEDAIYVVKLDIK